MKLFEKIFGINEFYNDKELKIEIKFLGKEFKGLLEIKNKYILLMDNFNKRYIREVGDIIEKILKLKKNIIYKKFSIKQKKFIKNEEALFELKNKYKILREQRNNVENRLNDIDEFYDEYDKIYKELKQIKIDLENIEQEIEKKRDTIKNFKKEFEVDEEFQNYQQIKDLYRKLKKIYKNKSFYDLKNNLDFVNVDEKLDVIFLKQKKEKLLKAIEEEKSQIKEIMKDEIFELLESIEDLDNFFDELRKELESELKELESFYDLENDEENETLLDNYQINYFYHMTHINNLKNITKYGLLSHNNNLVINRIDNEEVNSRRNFNDSIYNKNLHDYVPFYFNPRNPMLFVRNNIQNDIIIFGVDRNLIFKDEVLFTDGNASVNGTKFFSELEDLDKLNWNCLNSRYWSDFEDGKREIMAELLVSEKVDIKYIKKIYCYTEITKKRVEKILFDYPNIEIEVNQKLFF